MTPWLCLLLLFFPPPEMLWILIRTQYNEQFNMLICNEIMEYSMEYSMEEFR